MNLEVKDIPAKILPLLSKLRRYMVIIFVVVIVSLFGFLILRINSLTQREPSDELMMERLNTVQRPQIDERTVNRIQQLEDRNVEIRSLFEQARDNPFSENE
jgi:hypothetical protein